MGSVVGTFQHSKRLANTIYNTPALSSLQTTYYLLDRRSIPGPTPNLRRTKGEVFESAM